MHSLRWVEQELMTLNRGREESAQILKTLFNCEVDELMEEGAWRGRRP